MRKTFHSVILAGRRLKVIAISGRFPRIRDRGRGRHAAKRSIPRGAQEDASGRPLVVDEFGPAYFDTQPLRISRRRRSGQGCGRGFFQTIEGRSAATEPTGILHDAPFEPWVGVLMGCIRTKNKTDFRHSSFMSYFCQIYLY